MAPIQGLTATDLTERLDGPTSVTTGGLIFAHFLDHFVDHFFGTQLVVQMASLSSSFCFHLLRIFVWFHTRIWQSSSIFRQWSPTIRWLRILIQEGIHRNRDKLEVENHKLQNKFSKYAIDVLDDMLFSVPCLTILRDYFCNRGIQLHCLGYFLHVFTSKPQLPH